MLCLKVDMVNADKVLKALKKFDADVNVAMTKFLKTEGPSMEREIKQSMKTGGKKGRRGRRRGKKGRIGPRVWKQGRIGPRVWKQGRIGPRGGKQRVHSQPGQVPFVQSGRLKGSVGYLFQLAKNALFLDIGAIRGGEEVKYAHGLEVGTSKMAARPWLMPVVKKHLDTWGREMGIKVQAIKS